MKCETASKFPVSLHQVFLYLIINRLQLHRGGKAPVKIFPSRTSLLISTGGDKSSLVGIATPLANKMIKWPLPNHLGVPTWIAHCKVLRRSFIGWSALDGKTYVFP